MPIVLDIIYMHNLIKYISQFSNCLVSRVLYTLKKY